MFKKFSEKAKNNPKVSEEWFPKNPPPTHNTRNKEVYKELTAKTERLKNSPLFQMRKRLNAQVLVYLLCNTYNRTDYLIV